MISSYNKIHDAFKFNGVHYNNNDLKVLANDYILHGEADKKALGEFLIDWLNDSDFIIVNTSGSTGKPKQIQLQKDAMVNSAIATGTFFNLKPSDRALLCLPLNYIAGKMMLVRAMVLGLDIDCVEPNTNPQFDSKTTYDFCAMIPLQLSNTKERINNIKTLIVGGAQVSNTLKDSIKKLPNRIFETYGMTETITHIAVKQINSEASTSTFKILPNISISQDDRGCLLIDALKLLKEKIITNDVVKLHSETEFEWLGRYDNVINSGGLKLFPEEIEAKLQNTIANRFFITSEADEILGVKVIIIIEGKSYQLEQNTFSALNKHEIPKHIYFIDKFSETDSGKIQRKKTLQLIKS